MDFKETQAIYLPDGGFGFGGHIVTGKWKAQESDSAVRELGVQLEVNPNTVMRAYDYLQPGRSFVTSGEVGCFVDRRASKQITESRREEFVGRELPDIFRRMRFIWLFRSNWSWSSMKNIKQATILRKMRVILTVR